MYTGRNFADWTACDRQVQDLFLCCNDNKVGGVSKTLHKSVSFYSSSDDSFDIFRDFMLPLRRLYTIRVARSPVLMVAKKQNACEAVKGGCNNRGVSRKEVNPAVEIREAPGKGMGAFAARDIPKGAFIAEYAGELISHKEKNRRIAEITAHRNAEEKHYMMALDSQRIIDCKEKGNDASPNCKVETVYVVYDKRIMIYTTEDVPAAQEKTEVESNSSENATKKRKKRTVKADLPQEPPEKKTKSWSRRKVSSPVDQRSSSTGSPKKDQNVKHNGQISRPTVTFRKASSSTRSEVCVRPIFDVY
ncbi:SET domain protein [Teladorsagia circumcincta]|uniref:SET domain protein n=1 Tax=Teladorsagia circumcincta TaxID=45464 RepID=A0A2G9U858_TELCI|nr:SET domain protein [Teladorsagia circumcincta]